MHNVIVTVLSVYTVVTMYQLYFMYRTRDLLATWWQAETKSKAHAVKKAGSVILHNGKHKIRSEKGVAVIYTNEIGNFTYTILMCGRVAEFAKYSLSVHSAVLMAQMMVLYFELIPKSMVQTSLLGTMLLTVCVLYQSMSIRAENWKISEE